MFGLFLFLGIFLFQCLFLFHAYFLLSGNIRLCKSGCKLFQLVILNMFIWRIILWQLLFTWQTVMTPLSFKTSLTSGLPRTRAQRKSSKADRVPLSIPVVLTFPRVLIGNKPLSKTNNYQYRSNLTISWAQPESTMKSITQGTTPNTFESTCWHKFNDESPIV